MSAFTRYFNLTIDLGNPSNPLLGASTSLGRSSTSVQFTQGDKFTLRIFPTWNSATCALEDGSAIVFAARQTGIFTGELLFSATIFSKYTDESGLIYYEATLDLNTQAIADVLPANTASVAFTADIEIQNAANTERLSYRFAGTIVKQAYNGTEGVPTDADPPYPASDKVMVKHMNGARFATDGTEFYIFFPDSKWHKIIPQIGDNDTFLLAVDPNGLDSIPGE